VQFRNAEPYWDDYAPTAEGRRVAIKEMLDNPHWSFRLKPENIVRWVPIFDTIAGISIIVGDTERTGAQDSARMAATKEQALDGLNPHDAKLIRDGRHGKVLRLELDPDTLAVISARTEAV
jgi:hypothetical protein